MDGFGLGGGKRCTIGWQLKYLPTYEYRQSLLPGVIESRIARLRELLARAERSGDDRRAERIRRRIGSARLIGRRTGDNRAVRRARASKRYRGKD